MTYSRNGTSESTISDQQRLYFESLSNVTDEGAAPYVPVGGCRFYCKSSESIPECDDNSIALTVTSPPYWNSIDYDLHASEGSDKWYRNREYGQFGDTYESYLDKIATVFSEVLRTTIEGGFCAVVMGTILYKGKHFPAPFHLTERLTSLGWEFHQDIIWNKVTGGVKRAGSYIQRPMAGYYYPNIMTEYILVFRKEGKKRYDNRLALPVDDVFKRDVANNIWHIAPVPPNTIDHPCPYPDELVRRLVLLYSHEGDEVLDPFLGSGQTARVALQHGRRAVGYDIEPDYLILASERVHGESTRKFNLLPKFEKVPVNRAI